MAIQIGNPLPQSLLESELYNRRNEPIPLSELLEGASPVGLIFLRHFGCIGCAVQMAELRPHFEKLSQMEVKMILVGNGGVQYMDPFIHRHQLNRFHVTLVTDPTLKIHKEAGFQRSIWGLIGPASIAGHLKALLQGFRQEGIKGDHFQQGGTIAIDRKGTIIFYHQNQSVFHHAKSRAFVESLYSVAIAKRA